MPTRLTRESLKKKKNALLIINKSTKAFPLSNLLALPIGYPLALVYRISSSAPTENSYEIGYAAHLDPNQLLLTLSTAQ